MWHDMNPYDWLNKYVLQLSMVSIVNKCGLRIEVRHRNQPNKNKAALYKPLLYFYSHLKQLYISNRQGTSVINVGVVSIGVHISRHLKEELACARDKQLWVISNKVTQLRNYRIKPF